MAEVSQVNMASAAVPISDSRWLLETPHGWATITPELLDDLASFSGLAREACLERLSTYRYGQMAEAWAQASPQTSEEMRGFYGQTDAYIWSLSIWQAAGLYGFYNKIVRELATLQGDPPRPLRALDYGSGIGTSAIWLAEHGYDVTIADVPGATFDYARHRLRRRGLRFREAPITSDFPDLPGPFDTIVCFDVLEHVRQPDRVFRHLGANLVHPDGLISVVAPFEAQDGCEGYHLRENYERFGGGRWNLFMSGEGYAPLGGTFIWRRVPRLTGRLARYAHYRLWHASGVDIRYKRRTLR